MRRFCITVSKTFVAFRCLLSLRANKSHTSCNSVLNIWLHSHIMNLYFRFVYLLTHLDGSDFTKLLRTTPSLESSCKQNMADTCMSRLHKRLRSKTICAKHDSLEDEFDYLIHWICADFPKLWPRHRLWPYFEWFKLNSVKLVWLCYMQREWLQSCIVHVVSHV